MIRIEIRERVQHKTGVRKCWMRSQRNKHSKSEDIGKPGLISDACTGVSPGSIVPCTVSQDPGLRPRAPRRSANTSRLGPAPRRAYVSTKETRTDVSGGGRARLRDARRERARGMAW